MTLKSQEKVRVVFLTWRAVMAGYDRRDSPKPKSSKHTNTFFLVDSGTNRPGSQRMEHGGLLQIMVCYCIFHHFLPFCLFTFCG